MPFVNLHTVWINWLILTYWNPRIKTLPKANYGRRSGVVEAWGSGRTVPCLTMLCDAITVREMNRMEVKMLYCVSLTCILSQVGYYQPILSEKFFLHDHGKMWWRPKECCLLHRHHFLQTHDIIFQNSLKNKVQWKTICRGCSVKLWSYYEMKWNKECTGHCLLLYV